MPGIVERVARLSDRVYDRLRHKAAFGVSEADAAPGSFDQLRGRKYALVVTFRRNGEAVPSPVWFGVDDVGRAYFQAGRDSWKVKRIHNNPKALIVASNSRGKPKGRPLLGRARVLPENEWPHAEATLASAYGVGRKIYMRLLDGGVEGTYVEVAPVADDSLA